MNGLSDSDSDIIGDNLDNLNEKEKREMEKEIKNALKGNLDSLDIDEILEGSKMEGFSLEDFNSKDLSSIDNDEMDED